jgi:hypothetical protein
LLVAEGLTFTDLIGFAMTTAPMCESTRLNQFQSYSEVNYITPVRFAS